MGIEEMIKAKKSKAQKQRYAKVRQDASVTGRNMASKQMCEILSILQKLIKRRGLTKVLAAMREM